MDIVISVWILSLVSAISAIYVIKNDEPWGISGEDPQTNALPQLNHQPGTWKAATTRHHKHKHDTKLQHNEVEPVLDLRPSTPATTPAATTPGDKPPKDEREALRDWVRALPKGVFNMRNRMRLASVFLKAHSEDDVVKRLSKAAGHHGRPRARRRRKNTVKAYHPLLRFAELRVPNKGPSSRG